MKPIDLKIYSDFMIKTDQKLFLKSKILMFSNIFIDINLRINQVGYIHRVILETS